MNDMYSMDILLLIQSFLKYDCIIHSVFLYWFVPRYVMYSVTARLRIRHG